MSLINYQNLFGCAIKRIHQEHPQIGKSYIGEIKTYLNDAKHREWQRIEVLADKKCKFGCIYRIRFEHIVQDANKISYI